MPPGQDGENLDPVDPLLIDLAGIPGKRPGEIGKAPGVAQGAETGTNNGIARIKVPKLNVEKILREREQAEQSAPSSSNPKTSTKAVVKNGVGSKSARTTLDDFNKSQGGKSGRPGASSKSGGIGGVSVKKGRSDGTGDNGGEGGSASELALYAGEVQARLLTAWREIVAAEGESVSSGGTCGVTVNVDASGFVSFPAGSIPARRAHGRAREARVRPDRQLRQAAEGQVVQDRLHPRQPVRRLSGLSRGPRARSAPRRRRRAAGR
jgi:hypothetical protein